MQSPTDYRQYPLWDEKRVNLVSLYENRWIFRTFLEVGGDTILR